MNIGPKIISKFFLNYVMDEGQGKTQTKMFFFYFICPLKPVCAMYALVCVCLCIRLCERVPVCLLACCVDVAFFIDLVHTPRHFKLQ